MARQVSAFKDFTPGQGGSSAAPAAASGEPEGGEQGEDEEEGGQEEAEASGGGDYPPHSLMGLPALSPTMSQGEALPALKTNMALPRECLLRLTSLPAVS